jgi:serine/threonine protein kinase
MHLLTHSLVQTFNPKDEVGILKVAEYGLAKALKKRSKKHVAGDMTSMGKKKAAGGKGKGGDFDAIDNDSDDEVNLAFRGTGGNFHSVNEDGPYRYMAPEVFRGEPFTGKADVYSFAMIAYHLFEGLPPFANVEPFEAARVAAMEEKRPFWGVQNNFGQVVPMKMRVMVESCWVPDPEQRPEFEEIVDLLEQMVKKAKPVVTDDPKYVGVGKGRRRSGTYGHAYGGCSIS